MVYQLAYCSAATAEMTPATLGDILAKSQRNNARDGVTGILMYHDRIFFQVIEGAEAVIRSLHRRLLTDPRHTAMSIMWEGEVALRNFADWVMGFAGPTQLPGYSEDALVSLADLKTGDDASDQSNRIALALAQTVYEEFNGFERFRYRLRH